MLPYVDMDKTVPQSAVHCEDPQLCCQRLQKRKYTATLCDGASINISNEKVPTEDSAEQGA